MAKASPTWKGMRTASLIAGNLRYVRKPPIKVLGDHNEDNQKVTSSL